MSCRLVFPRVGRFVRQYAMVTLVIGYTVGPFFSTGFGGLAAQEGSFFPQFGPGDAASRPEIRDDSLKERADGMLGATLNYGRAWKSGDFLVRVRQGFDSVSRSDDELNLTGNVVEKMDYYRIAFDLPTGRLCVVRHSSFSELDLLRQKEGLDFQREGISLTAACVNHDHTVFKLDASGKYRRLEGYFRGFRHPDDLQDRFAKIGFPDFRAFFFAGDFRPNAFDTAATAVELRGQDRWKLAGVKDVAGGLVEIEYEYSTDRNSSPWAALSEIWEFDPQHLTPCSMRFAHRFSDPSKDRPGRAVEYEWTDLAGIRVLKSCRLKEKKHREVIGVVEIEGEKYCDVDFHWFGLNHDVDPSFFDGTLLNSTETALKQVDPAKCGANPLATPGGMPLMPGSGHGPTTPSNGGR